MDFLIWHGVLVMSVMAISFGAGYYTAIIRRRKNEST